MCVLLVFVEYQPIAINFVQPAYLYHESINKEKMAASLAKKAKRSFVWEHFDVLPCQTLTKCKHCKTNLKYIDSNTSAMKNHSRRLHPTIVVNNSEDQQSAGTTTKGTTAANQKHHGIGLLGFVSKYKCNSARQKELGM